MSDEFEGKERIESLEQFIEFSNQDDKNFVNCVFLFPFCSNGSELLIQKLADKPCDFYGSIFSENVKFEKWNPQNKQLEKIHINSPHCCPVNFHSNVN